MTVTSKGIDTTGDKWEIFKELCVRHFERKKNRQETSTQQLKQMKYIDAAFERPGVCEFSKFPLCFPILPLTIEKKGKIWIKCTSTFERYFLINPPFMQLAPLTKQKRRLWISSVELTNRINMNCPSFTPSVNFNCFKIPLLLLIIFFCRSTNTPLNIESRDQKWDRK